MKLSVNLLLEGKCFAAGTDVPDRLVPAHIAHKYAANGRDEPVLSATGTDKPKPVKPKPNQRYLRRGLGFKRYKQCQPQSGEPVYRRDPVTNGWVKTGRVRAEDLG